MPNPVIAIVGRPNVGKSTFFNRMLRQKKAIVDAQEGITRDRIYGEMEWVGHNLTFIDTGGYIPEDVDIFNSAVRRQAQAAVAEADLILFMVDGREDPTASDRSLAQFVRESGKKAIMMVNKCDTLEADKQINGFYELAIDPIQPISALTGRFSGDLLDLILVELNIKGVKATEDEDEGMRLAIVGMPNVGKSSLTNALLQKEQTIVTPIAGTTRDSIDSYLKYFGKTITLVDTAGLRKRSKVHDNIEFYSTVRTHRAIEHSHVALVLIDAEKGFGKQDKSIVDYVIKKGKGLVLLVNKWDLLEKDTHTVKEFTEEIAFQFRSLMHYPILFISALTKQRISKVLGVAQNVFETRKKSISTSKLNKFMHYLVIQQSPPAIQGKVINLKYMTQVHVAPHLFVIFTNYPTLIPTSYKRFIENQLREKFDLMGVPVRISFRRK
ncbi:MAG: ribosome biogenesis GTPase Der [Candidatus Marinimicrobia bacterium]|nr:ribosome biogenesis GTPase Der [Candidatus Neomarinimicrobiota bacterium]